MDFKIFFSKGNDMQKRTKANTNFFPKTSLFLFLSNGVEKALFDKRERIASSK